MFYCSNCGTKLKDEYKFCPKCGKSIENNSEKTDFDVLYDDVVSYIAKEKKISISLIQKEFGVSYTKAIKIMEKLEENGVVGPKNGTKPREILINNKKKDKEEDIADKIKANVEDIINTEDTTSSYDKKDINDNILLACLSYLGLLAFIPYFIKTDSKFVKYHATQGINLLIVWGIYTLVDNILGLIKVKTVVVDFGTMVGTKLVTPIWISLPMGIVGILLLAASILGIVYVCQGKAKELPIIGKIKIVK